MLLIFLFYKWERRNNLFCGTRDVLGTFLDPLLYARKFQNLLLQI
jgi:hypothetical protein